MFSGMWGEKNYKQSELGYEADKKYTIFGKNKALWNELDNNGSAKMSGLNKFMQGVGALAAVYTLGTNTAKSFVAESDPFGVTGAKV